MKRSVIVSYARTPFGKFGGALKEFQAVDLGAIAIQESLRRKNIDKKEIDLVIMGQVIPAGCGQIPARQASIKAGIPANVPVDQVNKVCASSLRAVTLADQIIRAGDATVIVAGGMESMSNAPFASKDMRWGHKMFDTKFEDLMVKDGLWCPYYDCHMALHGGTVAKEYDISREQQDIWAVNSQKKASDAITNGNLKYEIVPVELRNGTIISNDEAPRTDTTYEKLQKLKPIFSDTNTVTAGNAPGVNDGASSLIIMDEKAAEKGNMDIEAVVLGHSMYSEDPKNIATAPGNAINRLLKKTNMTVDDIDLFEINEAFAAVTLVSCKIIGCNPEKVNVNGGAIAFGHPLGASGGRILMTLASELKRQNKRYGIAAICSGMGQGDAILIENPNYK